MLMITSSLEESMREKIICEFSFFDNSWKTIQTKGEIPEKS
jgi:hypothetical protein